MKGLAAHHWRRQQLFVTTLKEKLMFEKILSLIERAVVALEKLASASSSMQAPSTGATTGATTEAPARAGRKAKAETLTPPATDDGDDFLNDTPAAKEAPKYERADVKKALQEYGAKHGMDKAQALFIKVSGVKALSDLPIEKFAEVIAAIK